MAVPAIKVEKPEAFRGHRHQRWPLALKNLLFSLKNTCRKKYYFVSVVLLVIILLD